jgi:hypothetical protein
MIKRTRAYLFRRGRSECQVLFDGLDPGVAVQDSSSANRARVSTRAHSRAQSGSSSQT